MWQSIQRWMFDSELKKRGLPVKSTARHSVNQALRIGILFDGTDENDRKIIHKFKKQLTASGKEVRSLAFINNKLPLDNVDYNAYNLRDVNWYGIPTGDKVTQFIEKEFDVLIPVIHRMTLHFEYIIAAAKARLIIGPAVSHAERYFNLISEQNNDDNLENIIQELLSNVSKVVQP